MVNCFIECFRFSIELSSLCLSTILRITVICVFGFAQSPIVINPLVSKVNTSNTLVSWILATNFIEYIFIALVDVDVGAGVENWNIGSLSLNFFIVLLVESIPFLDIFFYFMKFSLCLLVLIA